MDWLGFWEWEISGKTLNMNKPYNLIMINEEIIEQILRGDIEKLNISSIIVKSIEESEKKVFEIPPLKLCKIKERIFESFVKGKIEK